VHTHSAWNLQRHRAVSLRQHGFLLKYLFILWASKINEDDNADNDDDDDDDYDSEAEQTE